MSFPFFSTGGSTGGRSSPTRRSSTSSQKDPSYAFVRPSHSGASSHRSASSSYKRRPRDNYIARLYAKIRRYLRQLWAYVRRHPVKVLLPVVMALVSGGVLHNVARSFGVTLPEFLRGDAGRGGGLGGAVKGMNHGFGVNDAFYGSQMGAEGGGAGGWFGGDMGGVAKGAMKMASAFL